MLVIRDSAFRALQNAIVEATHSLTDEIGVRRSLSTIDGGQLRSAAMVALMIAAGGEVVWPGGEKLRLRQPQPMPSVVEISPPDGLRP